MPIYKVQGPDGKVYKFEGPEGASPEEVTAFAEQNFDKLQTPDQTKDRSFDPEAAFVGATKGIPFSDEIMAAGAAAIAHVKDGADYGQYYDEFKQVLNEDAEAQRAKSPWSYGAGNVAGAGALASLAPARFTAALNEGSLLARGVKGAAVGLPTGAVYGAGEGEGDQRIKNAVEGAVYGTIGGGIGGGVVGPALEAGAGAIASGARQMGAGLRSLTQRQGGNTVEVLVDSPDVIAQMQAGAQAQAQANTANVSYNGPNRMNLTRGQLTQDPKWQSLESGAQAGAYGDEAQRLALQAREMQNNQAKELITKFAGGEDDVYSVADQLQSKLKDEYKTARKQTSAAYKQAGELNQSPVNVDASYIRQSIAPKLQEYMRKGDDGLGFDLARPEMSYAKKLYQQGVSVLDMPKLTGMNFVRMEHWRGRVSAAAANSKDGAERKFLKGLLNRYDVEMENLPKEAIKSGNAEVIDAMEKARSLRAEQGWRFERNKVIKNILDNDEITPEQFANTVMSAGGAGFNSKAPNMLDGLMKSAGDKAPQVLETYRRGAWSKILRDSMSSEVKQGGEQMISFDKLATNLDSYINRNPTLFNKLHPSAEDRAAIKQFQNDVKLIKSLKPGTKNYSNTAYTIMGFVNKLAPGMANAGIGQLSIGGAITGIAKGGAQQDVQKSLAPVLRGVADELNNGRFNFSATFSAGSTPSTSTIPIIEVTPQDKR